MNARKLFALLGWLMQNSEAAFITVEELHSAVDDIHNLKNLSPGQEVVFPGVPMASGGAHYSVEIHVVRSDSADAAATPGTRAPDKGG